MYTKNLCKLLFTTALALFLLDGCASNRLSRCSESAPSRGYFCYQGHNFGKDLSPTYKSGIRDGCHTANGTFTKNYGLSSSSEMYIKGWELGRATCKLVIPDEAAEGTMRTQYQQSIDEKAYYGQ